MNNHVHPKPGHTPVVTELQIPEVMSFDQCRKSFSVEELDVPAVLKRAEVAIHPTCNCQRQIFKVAVVRRG